VARKMYRVFFEMDYPDGMLDNESTNPQPITSTLLLHRLLFAGADAEGYSCEAWKDGLDLGFKFVEVP